MPVLVADPDGATGHAVVLALSRGGGEVRVYLDEHRVDPEQALAFRRLGCKTARGALDDEARLELALEQAHTLVHVGGGPLRDPADVVDGVADVVGAAIGAGCRRLIWASHLGADEPGSSAYLRACAEAEALLAEAPLETVVVRRALTYGPGDELTAALARGGGARPPVAPARHAPLFVDDLAAAIATADRMGRAAGSAGDLHLVLTLAGPDLVTVAQLGEMLGGAPGGPWPDAGTAGLPLHTLDLLARDSVPGPDVVGRDGTPLAVGVARCRVT